VKTIFATGKMSKCSIAESDARLSPLIWRGMAKARELAKV